MPVNVPPRAALEKFLSSSTRHTRRIEIYEQDGITRWNKDVTSRLKDGSVSVDYDRDERRSLDLVLSNEDGALSNAPGELWFDKIIKVFRGVEVNEPHRTPKIAVISDMTAENSIAESFRHTIVSRGFGDVYVNTLASDYYADIFPFDIIVGLGNADATQVDLMRQAYESGKSVLTMGADSEGFLSAEFPSTTYTAVAPESISPLTNVSNPVAKGWSTFSATNSASINVPTIVTDQYTLIAMSGSDASLSRVAALSEPIRGGRAVVLSLHVDSAQFQSIPFSNFITSSLSWLNTTTVVGTWEVQIGEFMVDRISEPHFPYEMRITGRDYTKKCMLSKFTQATQFDAGMALESIIAAIAGAAGITKRSLPSTGVVVGRAFFYERGTTRWEAMKDIANAYNYEIYFDASGYLVIREYNDPLSTAPTVWINTGKDGQIASYEKSSSDSRLFNHVLVYNETSDSDAVSLWAEVANEDEGSPTSIQEIGDRLYTYSSAFIETQSQADELALTLLNIYSLEEFELNFETLMLPWLEVGDIIGWTDPRPSAGDPTTFLLSTLSMPLSLSPMSGTAKRVTIVN